MSGILDQLSGGGERWKAWNVDQEPDPENNAEQSEDGIGPSPGDVGSVRSDMVPDPSSNDGDDTGWTVEDAIADRDATEVISPVVDPQASDPADRPRRSSNILDQLSSPSRGMPAAVDPPADGIPSAVLRLEDRLDESLEDDGPGSVPTIRPNAFTPRRIRLILASAVAVMVTAGACMLAPHIMQMRESRVCEASHTDAVEAVETLKKNITAAKAYKVSSDDTATTVKDIGKLTTLASRRIPSIKTCPSTGFEAIKAVSSANLQTADKATNLSDDMAALVKKIGKARDRQELASARRTLTERIDTASKLLSSSEGKTDDDTVRTTLRNTLKKAETLKDSKDVSKLEKTTETLQAAIDKVNSSVASRESREDKERQEREEAERKQQEETSQQQSEAQERTQQSQSYTPQYQTPQRSYTTPRQQTATPSTPQTPSTPSQPSDSGTTTPADPGNNGVIM